MSDLLCKVCGTQFKKMVFEDGSAHSPFKNPDATYKILVIGDSGVGKTSLLLRFADGTWTDTYISSIGIDFKSAGVTLKDGKKINLNIWDTAGQERYMALATSYYRDADGIILVYDVTDEDSYKQIPAWLTEIDRYAPKKPEWAKEKNIQNFETSAKDGTNVELAFKTMAEVIYEKKALMA